MVCGLPTVYELPWAVLLCIGYIGYIWYLGVWFIELYVVWYVVGKLLDWRRVIPCLVGGIALVWVLVRVFCVWVSVAVVKIVLVLWIRIDRWCISIVTVPNIIISILLVIVVVV